jgi:hypothetical protein
MTSTAGFDPERQRLEEDRLGQANWRRWGPYVSERSWGTVREDYSPDGAAWDYFPHDLARSRAYRWGEDGLAGLCDRYQLLVFALALWNGRDPILKERLFGLVPAETNHGEDVKEYYFYLDSTPTHSYLRYLYKYPQREFPYRQLIEQSRQRSRSEPEYELLDTGIFDDDRYFDVVVEYAKASPEDIAIQITAWNRGPDPAPLHILPHLWFRNTWGWKPTPAGVQGGEHPPLDPLRQTVGRPFVRWHSQSEAGVTLLADDSPAEPLRNLLFDYRLGERFLHAQPGGEPLFTDNETNRERLWHVPNTTPFVKDAFHRHLIQGENYCVNPARTGTKACLHYTLTIPPGRSAVLHLRLTDQPGASWREVEAIVAQRRQEADWFYERLHPPRASEDEKLVQRQALAGLLWSKQVYLFDVAAWMDGDDPTLPPPECRKTLRNVHWRHLNSQRVLSMPDKWEYPWFAAWDLAFHAVTLALVDPEFAKEQLWLMLFEQFQHPNGQIPAYEWEFSDLNPPVHAWAVWRVYNIARRHTGRSDRQFLEKCFHKLLINFAWWVNKVDAEGNNVFEGGFLGLDNIAMFDRSQRFADGTMLKQSDATGWMGMFCLNLMRIALELARTNPAYNALATKFFEHYVYIGAAMKHIGGRAFELWSERDGFFYDSLRRPDGSFHKCRVRSLVGLIPLYAIERLEETWLGPFPEFRGNFDWFLRNRTRITQRCVTTLTREEQRVHVLALINEEQLRRLLARVLDPEEFLSPYGVRSLSKYHQQHPFVFAGLSVGYEPAEALSTLKGGNSNWRGPIWFPTNFLMIDALRKLGQAYGPSFLIQCPGAGPGEAPGTLTDLARDLADRLIRLFTRDAAGRRPICGRQEKFQTDPHWRDHLLFYEYFHGDTGAGLGASHQTGWTGLVATLIDEWRR